MPAFDDGMDKSSAVAFPQDVPGFLGRYLAVIMRPFFDKDVPVETEHYLCTYRVVAILNTARQVHGPGQALPPCPRLPRHHRGSTGMPSLPCAVGIGYRSDRLLSGYPGPA